MGGGVGGVGDEGGDSSDDRERRTTATTASDEAAVAAKRGDEAGTRRIDLRSVTRRRRRWAGSSTSGEATGGKLGPSPLYCNYMGFIYLVSHSRRRGVAEPLEASIYII